jgi:hypothetical protein
MLSREHINALAAEAAAVLDVSAEVIAATPAGHDTHTVEVILTVTDCSEESCRLIVRLDRDQSHDEVRAAILANLREHPNLHG